MKTILTTACALIITLSFAGCSAEPGSKAWCEQMKQKEKGKWNADEAATFAKHCVLGNYKE